MFKNFPNEKSCIPYKVGNLLQINWLVCTFSVVVIVLNVFINYVAWKTFPMHFYFVKKGACASNKKWQQKPIFFHSFKSFYVI